MGGSVSVCYSDTMKNFPALCLAAVAMLLASCASPIAKRIEHNQDLFNTLSERHKAMVQKGQIEEGMGKPAVFFAWGKPDRAFKGSRSGRTYERWSFAAFQAVPTWTTGFAVGVNQWSQRAYHTGSFSYDRALYYGPEFNYVPYEAARVEFENGIVTAWSEER